MFLHCKEDMNKVPSTLFQCLCFCIASNGRSVLPLGREGFKSINNFSEKNWLLIPQVTKLIFLQCTKREGTINIEGQNV